MSETYLECIGGPELDRLRAQHEAWSEDTTSILLAAELQKCRSVLEVGCGPGFVTLDMVSGINPSAKYTAVDVSDYYLNHLRQESSQRGLSNVEVVRADLMQPVEPLGEHHIAFCRWFLAWVTRGIDTVLENVHRSLTPGGCFVSMEYLTLRSACHSPPCASLLPYVEAWEQFYRDCGGTTELGSMLLQKLSERGFRVEKVRTAGGMARRGHPLFGWWQRLFDDFHEKFVERGYLTAAQTDELKEYWRQAESDPSAFVYSPILLQTIARKV